MYPTQPPGMPDDEWNALAAINHDHGEEYQGQFDSERRLLRERGYDSFEYPQLHPFEPRPAYAAASPAEREYQTERRQRQLLNEHPHTAWVQLTAADIDQIAEMTKLTAFQMQIEVHEGVFITFQGGRYHSDETEPADFGTLAEIKAAIDELYGICRHEFDPYENGSDEESWHFKRACRFCKHVWWSLHCMCERRTCPRCNES